RLGSVILLGIVTFLPALHAAEVRMTNVDLVASRVQLLATRSDLIVISTWHHGITWNRYYRGAAPWMTVPPIEFHRWHRPDLIKKNMEADQTVPVRAVESRIAATLRSGNRVFILGNLPMVPRGKKPVILPRAPLHGNEWPMALYQNHWALTLGYFVQQHSTSITVARVNAIRRVSGYENPPLVIVTGWKP
nr:hypothetical protein [Gemmatimonadota bacterium]